LKHQTEGKISEILSQSKNELFLNGWTHDRTDWGQVFIVYRYDLTSKDVDMDFCFQIINLQFYPTKLVYSGDELIEFQLHDWHRVSANDSKMQYYKTRVDTRMKQKLSSCVKNLKGDFYLHGSLTDEPRWMGGPISIGSVYYPLVLDQSVEDLKSINHFLNTNCLDEG
jgi:hypothetical protein